MAHFLKKLRCVQIKIFLILCWSRIFLMGNSMSRFLYFRLFNTVDSKNINLAMTGLEPRTYGVGSNRSANLATTKTEETIFYR